MLIEKSEKLYQKAQEKIKLQTYAEQLEGFQTRKNEIQEAVAKLSSLMESLRPFRDRALINLETTQKIDHFLQFIIQTETNFQNDPEWILDNKNFKGRQLNLGINKLVNFYEKELSEAWQYYLNKNVPTTNSDFLSLLGQVPNFKQTVQRIEQLKQNIPKDHYPKNEKEFTNVEEVIQSLQNVWETLSAEEVPDSVLKFLRATANQGASLDLLTPEVQAWIEEYGISDSLRIRLT